MVRKHDSQFTTETCYFGIVCYTVDDEYNEYKFSCRIEFAVITEGKHQGCFEILYIFIVIDVIIVSQCLLDHNDCNDDRNYRLELFLLN